MTNKHVLWDLEGKKINQNNEKTYFKLKINLNFYFSWAYDANLVELKNVSNIGGTDTFVLNSEWDLLRKYISII